MNVKRCLLLNRHLEADDFPREVPTVSSRSLEWPDITDFVIYKAVCAVSSFSPGKDQVPAKILRAG